MAEKVSGVVLSIHVKGPAPTQFIKVEEVLVHGSGTLNEALEGGQSTFTLELTRGKVEPGEPLLVGEPVYVRGTQNGAKFTLPIPLKITHAQHPWKLSGKVGATG